MGEWRELFAAQADPGVRRAGEGMDEAGIQTAALASGLDFARIEVRDVRDKTELLRAIAAALEFPDYFGMNWDALNDCLTDMSWRNATGYVILFTGWQQAEESIAGDLGSLTRVLEGAARFWAEREVPFYAILAG